MRAEDLHAEGVVVAKIFGFAVFGYIRDNRAVFVCLRVERGGVVYARGKQAGGAVSVGLYAGDR